MNVEIINVGTELLLGEIVNTNATVLQKICRDLGFNVFYQTVVGDNPERLYDCLKLAFDRGATCVMTTGGLGPTSDDLTKELSAKYLGLEMVYFEDEAMKVEKKCQYCTGVDQIPKNNFKQAYFPKDAFILENNMGTANGCVMSKDDRMIINLPGPPKELSYVIEHSLLPYLEKYRQDTIFTFDYLTMFIGESKIDEVLRDMIDAQNQVSIALYAGEQTVRIRLAVKAKSQEEADQYMKDIKMEIEKRLGDYILKEKNLEDAVETIMVPIKICYKSEFRLHDDFLKAFRSNQAKLVMTIDVRKEELGEVVEVTLNDYSFEIPTFVEAHYSYARVEARIVGELYRYIYEHPLLR